MLRSISSLFILGLLVFNFGCAGTAGDKAGDFEYSRNVGPVTAYDLQDKTTILLNKYQYQVERDEATGDRRYIETMWKYRNPHADEASQGVVSSRDRLILHATPRVRGTGGGTGLSRVRLVCETMVQFQGSEVWQRVPMTDMCKDYFKKVANDFKSEYSTGMRRY